ncbi:MAG: hypothetical protein V7L29_10130 [Nostoc sp.]|uniref:hypothetical protein n=1 Tax=Nostoc sp. TaxID=1180 RepID=UPI002FF0A78E
MSVLKSSDACGGLRQRRKPPLRRQLLKSGNAKSEQVGKPQGRTGSTFRYDELRLHAQG